MDYRENRRESVFSSIGSSRMENEGGSNKGNNIQDEILVAYNTYLQARCIQKVQENNMEKAKCGIKEKQLQLKKLEAQFEALRRRRLEIQYLAETSNTLAILEENLQSMLKSYPPNILDDMSQIRNDLQHIINQLPVKGATVNRDESEQIMQILPRVKQTLEKLQDSIDNKDEVHRETAEKCTSLVNSISRIMETQKRCNDMVDEMVALGLRVSAMNILKARYMGSDK